MMKKADSQDSCEKEKNAMEPKKRGRSAGGGADGARASALEESGQHRAEAQPSDSQAQSPTASTTQLSPIAPFVSKTYGIVNDESEDIVSWSHSDGEDTFVIKRVSDFQEQVLPRFFSHRNYASFVRQLNNHGFSRVRSPSSAGDGRGGRPEQEAQWWEFKHPKFRRGDKRLLSEIKRRKEKKRPTSGAAHSRLFPPQSSLIRGGSHEGFQGEGACDFRREMEHMREHMQNMNDKIDDLKSLVMELVGCVRDCGIPVSVSVSVPQSPRRENMREGRGEGVGGDGSRKEVNALGPEICYPSPRPRQRPQEQHPQQQQSCQLQPEQQQRQQHASVEAPPTLPPPSTQQHQHQELHQQVKQDQEHQKKHPRHLSTGRRINPRRSDSDSSSHGSASLPNAQQVSSDEPPHEEPSSDGRHRVDTEAAGKVDRSQTKDNSRPPSPTEEPRKRVRMDAVPYHDIQHPHPPAMASASAPNVGPRTNLDTHVESLTEPPRESHAMGSGSMNNNAMPEVVRSSNNAYQDVRIGYPPEGAPSSGSGGIQHMGNMAHWQRPWPDGAMEGAYPYHVPMRVTGYPIAMPPMRYAVPGPGAPFVAVRGGGAPAGAIPFSAPPSTMLSFRQSSQGQSHAAAPLHGRSP